MSFRFKCYKKLKKKLGEIDSIVEVMELSIRELVQNITNKPNYIELLSKKHNIKVNDVNIKNLEDRVMKLHIINVYEQLEDYFEELIKEHPKIKNKKDKEQEETYIDFIIKKLKIENIVKSEIEYHIINYYRLIRNNFIHSSKKQINEKFYEFSKDIESSKYSKLNAPNKFDNLTFDDFILFTYSIKNFAELINQVGKPENDILVNGIIEKHKLKLNQLSNNENRKQNFIKSLLLNEYNIKDDLLVDEIMKG